MLEKNKRLEKRTKERNWDWNIKIDEMHLPKENKLGIAQPSDCDVFVTVAIPSVPEGCLLNCVR
jgi:hypothetical protein